MEPPGDSRRERGEMLGFRIQRSQGEIEIRTRMGIQNKNATCHVIKVLLDCDCSRERGEDSHHPQLQAVVRAGQGALAQGLRGLNPIR